MAFGGPTGNMFRNTALWYQEQMRVARPRKRRHAWEFVAIGVIVAAAIVGTVVVAITT